MIKEHKIVLAGLARVKKDCAALAARGAKVGRVIKQLTEAEETISSRVKAYERSGAKE